MPAPTFTTGNAITQTELRYMMVTKPLCFVYASGGQAMANSVDTPLLLDTEVINRYNMHEGSSSRISIGLELGWYRVSGHIGWMPHPAPSNQVKVSLAKNGTILPYTVRYLAATTIPGLNYIATDAIIQSTGPTDWVELYGTIGGADGATISAGQGGMLSVEYLGA